MKTILLVVVLSTIAAAQTKPAEVSPLKIESKTPVFQGGPTIPYLYQFFTQSSKLVMSISLDGIVTFGEGMTSDQASREAAKEFGKYFGRTASLEDVQRVAKQAYTCGLIDALFTWEESAGDKDGATRVARLQKDNKCDSVHALFKEGGAK